MKNRAVFVILVLFLVATLFFWFQIWKIEDLPPKESPPVSTTEEVEAFVELIKGLPTDEPKPLVKLSGRDPFFMKDADDQPGATTKQSENFVLSSIMYSDLSALAVVNGKILFEGDTIPESRFMIKSIEIDKVEISNGAKKYTLEISNSSR